MNRVHRKIWSARLGAFVAVAETAKGRGKVAGSATVGAVAMAIGAMAGAHAAGLAPGALPTGGQVSAGSAAISSSGNTLNVIQGSQRAAINWQSFNIGSAGTVNFVQPNAQAIVLNRVVGNERSVIDGTLNANGQVWLLNAAGFLINRGASINAGGLVVTPLDISDADFMAGRSSFENHGAAGRVINFGSLNAPGSYVALLGPQVVNEGLVTARLGTAVLAAGDKVTLNFNGDSLVSATVDRGALGALVANRQAIIADGGLVLLTAKGVDDVMAGVVNNSGEVRAQTVAERQGRIYLLGGMEHDRVELAGRLDAGAPAGGRGGFVETSAAHVSIADGAQVDTLSAGGQHGNWLIDPYDFTIAASGGDITGAALGTALASGNVTIAAASGSVSCTGASCGAGNASGNGDIFVNDSIAKTAGGDTTLTLKADRSITLAANQSISSTSGKLNVLFSANNSGANAGTITLGSNSSITSNGGNVVLGSALSGGLPSSDRSVDITMQGGGATINAGSGDVRLYGRNLAFSAYSNILGNNIQAQLATLNMSSTAGVKLTAANTISFDNTGAFTFRGTYSPPAGSAYITSASKTTMTAGNGISISANGITIRDSNLKLANGGTNTLSLSSLGTISFTDASVQFVGTPALSIALRQSQAQSTVSSINSSYSTLDGYLTGLNLTLDQFALTSNGGLTLSGGTHFGLKGAPYTLKVYSDTTARTIAPKSIDNGRLAFGTGLQDSINNLGNLYQPFYFDDVLDRWFKLTYSNYPLDIAIGAGGDGSAGWNTNGQIVSSNGGTANLSSVISGVSYDTSGLSGGIGRVIVTYTVTVPSSVGTFHLKNTYSLGAGDSFIRTLTEVTNTGGATLDNTRLWIGTRDDWVAISDSNIKTKGNLTSTGFTRITTQNEQAKSILISEFDPITDGVTGSAILFHSTNADADTITDSCCSFNNITNKNPRVSAIATTKQDGSYGLFMNFGNLATAESKSVTWYYGATSLSNVNNLITQVVQGVAADNAPPPVPPSTALELAVSNATNPATLPNTSSLTGSTPLSAPSTSSTANVVNVPSGVNLQFAPNEQLMIVSSLNGDVPNNPVTLSQAREMMQPAGGAAGGSGGSGSSGGTTGSGTAASGSSGGSAGSGSAGDSAGAQGQGSSGGSGGSGGAAAEGGSGGSSGGGNGGSAGSSRGTQSGEGGGASGTATADGAGSSSENDGERERERAVTIPASRNSLVQIVNGGVRLPGGVEQQLFVIKK
ncbi:MAG: filamentous hemagglutinin N-terminal domain-containing protein [Aquabacterium sp.]|jgi:filamentous hemagglutinin family protein|nr:MAG: filamentous hemagglutinin N-terminal domain-containing protein [Aquabacterium sp.]